MSTLNGGPKYLLDTLPGRGAAAAYSLRRLSNNYTGSLVRVRRSSDNVEQDIGFDVNGNLNTAALLSFVGANNGFVTTWYDQSGNGRNAVQATAGNQPSIILSGTLITQNGKPVAVFEGRPDFLTTTSSFATNPAFSMLFVGIHSINNNFGVTPVYHGNDNSNGIGFFRSGNTYNGLLAGGIVFIPTSTVNNNYTLFSVYRSGASQPYNYFRNSGQVALTSNGSTNFNAVTGSFKIGSSNSMQTMISEVLYWLNDKLTDRVNIESNINNYYKIY